MLISGGKKDKWLIIPLKLLQHFLSSIRWKTSFLNWLQYNYFWAIVNNLRLPIEFWQKYSTQNTIFDVLCQKVGDYSLLTFSKITLSKSQQMIKKYLYAHFVKIHLLKGHNVKNDFVKKKKIIKVLTQVKSLCWKFYNSLYSFHKVILPMAFWKITFSKVWLL